MVEIDDLFEYFVRMVIKDMMFVSGNGLVTFVEEVLLVFDQLNELVRDPQNRVLQEMEYSDFKDLFILNSILLDVISHHDHVQYFQIGQRNQH